MFLEGSLFWLIPSFSFSQTRLFHTIIYKMENSIDGMSSREEYEQQLYELRKQLSVSQAMEKEYMIEVDQLQKKFDCEIANEKHKLKILEEKYTLALQEMTSKVEYIEQEKRTIETESRKQATKMEYKIKHLEQQLEQACDKKCNDLFQACQVENKMLKQKEKELVNQLSQLQEETMSYLRKIEELNNSLTQVKELNLIQKEELATKTNTIVELRDEVALLKSDLETKLKPESDNKKGNSLFAEVEDKRQSMKKILEDETKKNRALKKQYLDKCAEASKYRCEYVHLCRKMEEMDSTMKEADKQLISSYKIRNQFLEKEVEKLTNQKPPYIISCADGDALKFIEAFAETKRKECEKLKSELEMQSVKALFSSQNVHDLQVQLRKTEVQLIEARGRLIKLQEEIEKGKGGQIRHMDVSILHHAGKSPSREVWPQK